MAWAAAGLTLLPLLAHAAWSAWTHRARPQQAARAVHASLRGDWFDAVGRQPGSEVLAVQALRNSLMSASMAASTAVLGLMGTITLSAPSLGAGPAVSPRLAMELLLLVLLFAALVASALAVRHYHHAGFVGAMPVASPERQRWQPVGRRHLHQAGVLYGWSLRCLLAVAAPVAYLLHPLAGPVAAAATAAVLAAMDRPTT